MARDRLKSRSALQYGPAERDWQVLAPASTLVFAGLLWRRRRIAAWHWLAAIGFGMALVAALGFLLDVPKPPATTAVV